MSESKFFRGDTSFPQTLDEKGRCCGRKPLTYKRERQRFCDRCCRSYHLYQNFQIDNWAEDCTHVCDEEGETGLMPRKIYVASRASIPERGQMWRDIRDQSIATITSTWIDEDGEGQTADMSELWWRISEEIAQSDKLVLYAENDDFPLKGALIEAGIALGMGKPVVVCLPGVPVFEPSMRPIGSWIKHPLVSRIDEVLRAIQ